MSNTRYVYYIDEAVTDLLEARELGVSALEDEGLQMVLEYTEIQYHEGVELGDAILIDVQVKDVEDTSIVLGFDVREEGDLRLLAEGHESFRIVSSSDHRDLAVPPTVKARLL